MDNVTKFEIDPAIINQTDQCKACYRCLTDPAYKLCKIEYVTADSAVLFVFNEQCKNCGYQISFGGGTVCSCPIRKEIMKQYNC